MASETVLRTSGVCTTILGVMNQFQAFTDLPYNAMFDTTLNKKYEVLNQNTADYPFHAPVTMPVLKYFGIGTRGFQNIDDQQNALPYPGDARCMDLYQPLPIRCIPVEEELNPGVFSAEDRLKYRMRVVQTFNGIQYACYYLKLIEFTGGVKIIKKDANGTETDYPLDPTWLTPNPPVLTMNQIGGNIDTNVNRIIIRATGECRISNEEIMEAVNAIYNGEQQYARISEIGYYTGCDVPVTRSGTVPVIETPLKADSPETSDFNEAQFVQLAKTHNFTGTDLSTAGSYIRPTISLESECCINGTMA